MPARPTYRGCEQFLIGVCDVAADYHAFEERRRLLHEDHHRTELLNSARRVHNASETVGHGL